VVIGIATNVTAIYATGNIGNLGLKPSINFAFWIDIVTAKTATPTKVDSKLTVAQLESLKRATKALEGTWGRKGKPQRPED
jgi:hypothetical protein